MSLLDQVKIPRYYQLAEELRRDIEAGRLQPGDQMPSYLAMKARHGLSQNTWEKIYGLLEKEGLIVREPGRGVFVAEPRRRESSHIIGISGIHETLKQTFYYSHVLEGIYEAASRAGREVLLLTETSTAPARAAVRWETVDGVILTSGPAPNQPPLLPAVSIFFPSPGAYLVTADDNRGASAALRHLLELGHRRIAFILASSDDVTSNARGAAFRRVLGESGMALDPAALKFARDCPVTGSYSAQGYHMVTEWLAGDWRARGYTALLALNDEIALGALKAFRESSIRVPEEVSVVGYDGTELCRHCVPTLTTIEVPLHDIGAAAMTKLIEMIDGGRNMDGTTVLPTRLLAQESTAKVGNWL